MRPVAPTLLHATLETLLTPSEQHLDDWRDAVCRSLRALVEADVVFFRLSDQGPSRIDPVGPLPLRDAYRREYRPLDPWPRFSLKPGESRIDTPESLIGAQNLRRDLYYNEFMRGYGLYDYVGVQVGTTPGAHVHIGIFNLDRSRGGGHAEDTVLRLRMVMSALQSGLRAWVVARRQPDGVAPILDSLSDALLLCDNAGRTLHANTALVDLLAQNPDQRLLRLGLDAAVEDIVRARSGETFELLRMPAVREIPTALGTYRIRSVIADAIASPFGGVLIILEPPGRTAPDDSTLQREFGLTPKETKVARLLSMGRDNAEIAATLQIAETTARNHTARVMSKFGVSSRAQIHPILQP